MRKFIGLAAAAIIAGGGLVACGNQTNYTPSNTRSTSESEFGDYDGLCRDDRTNLRVDDDYCEDRAIGYSRIKMKKGKKAPKLGKAFKATDIVGGAPSASVSKRPAAPKPNNPSTGTTEVKKKSSWLTKQGKKGNSGTGSGKTSSRKR